MGAALLLGRRLYWLFAAGAGFVIGATLSAELLQGQGVWMQLLIALIAGVNRALAPCGALSTGDQRRAATLGHARQGSSLRTREQVGHVACKGGLERMAQEIECGDERRAMAKCPAQEGTLGRFARRVDKA